MRNTEYGIQNADYTTVVMVRPTQHQRIDPRALEKRTQVIGGELFAAAKHEHAHLSILNRWTSQVLSWCLAAPALKGNVLRFIDVLPSLRTPRDIAQHVREYFPTTDFRLPGALRLGASLARNGLLTHRALAALVKQLTEQVARQFIAESHTEGASHVIQALATRGATCSLDILGEQILSEAEADRYVAQCRQLLKQSALSYAALPASGRPMTCGPMVNLSVKPSALAPRFDPISPAQSIEGAMSRLAPLLQEAATQGALINFDMEQYELRDLTLALVKAVLTQTNGTPRAALGIVIQAYLCDSLSIVEEWLIWLATQQQPLTIRLVKGAYWDYERAQASQCGWPAPVHQEKAATDLAFEQLTERLLQAHPLVTTAIASHNVRSIAHAMAVAELLGLAKHQLEFQLLYGMGDALHAAIVARGYPVRIYTPIGELIPGMAYLVRRILENTSNESFLRHEYLQERSADELLRAPRQSSEVAQKADCSERDGWHIEPLTDFSKPAERQRMVDALASVRAQLGQRYPLLLGDQALETPKTLTVRNPAHPQQIIGLVSCASQAEVDRAVQIAQAAQPHWARVPLRERVACLRRAAALMRERRDEWAAWTMLEVGKTWREADVEIIEAIEYLEYYSYRMTALANSDELIQLPGERNQSRYLPRGIAVVIAPWNFPAAILTGMTSAALVTGNAVIMKPAEQSSVIAAHIARLLRDAGVPSGIIQFLPGIGEEIGVALVHHPGTHAVFFTGSKTVGMSIIEACGHVQPGQRFIKHVVTEMGGKNAIIIDADADLDAAVAGTLRSTFNYAGQKCSAASRVIVHEAVYERFVSRLRAATDRLVLGDPTDPGTDIGPLIDASARERLTRALERAGGVAHVAYRYPASRIPTEGYFFSPTIVTDVPRQDPLAKEELFGPLLCVFRVNSFDDALALANDTDYALTGGVYSRSPSHIEQAIQAFDVGNLYINRPITGAMVGRQPFGGHRLSGLGTKAGGPDYLLQFLLPKTISTNTTRHGMPLE